MGGGRGGQWGEWGVGGEAGQEDHVGQWMETQPTHSSLDRKGAGGGGYGQGEVRAGGRGEGGEGGMLAWLIYKPIFYLRTIYKPFTNLFTNSILKEKGEKAPFADQNLTVVPLSKERALFLSIILEFVNRFANGMQMAIGFVNRPAPSFPPTASHPPTPPSTPPLRFATSVRLLVRQLLPIQHGDRFSRSADEGDWWTSASP